VRELKKTIDNLMEANSKLVSNTKNKIALLEGELDRYKAGGAVPAGPAAGKAGEVTRVFFIFYIYIVLFRQARQQGFIGR
jgi:hypothetical protein